MIDALRSFIDEMTGGGRAPQEFAEDDHRVAAVALLVHLANADGTLDTAERLRLQRIVEDRYGLGEAEAKRLIARAAADEREAVDLYHFTSILKRRLDETGRRAVVDALWDIAFADGKVHELEENIVWRVAELLAVPPRARVESRHRAEQEGAEAPADAGPWGAKARPA